MTKKVFAGFFKKAIPIVGGAIGGTITFFSFAPCCNKLRDTLRNTILSNTAVVIDESEVIAVISGEEDITDIALDD